MSTQNQLFALPIRVYFQDTDAAGMVFHANYLNFMERARTEWLREYCGCNTAMLLNDLKVVFVIRAVHLGYFRPAVLDDLLHVTAQVKELGRSRVVISQMVLRGEDKLAEAEIHLVCVNAGENKPVAIPDMLRVQWEAFCEENTNENTNLKSSV